MSQARLLIAAPSSGSGKTTLSMMLCAGLQARGLRVQPFKVGPDYIDPSHLAAVCARPCYNLDGFFLEPAALRKRFSDASQQADICVVEGVMGLFDGKDAQGKQASSAALARLLALPVVLVIDASAMAGSIAALAQGFANFDPQVKVVGVIANRVGSERHAALLEAALEAIGLPLLGAVQRDDDLHIPSRHLGLHMAAEVTNPNAMAHSAERQLDLDAILHLARTVTDIETDIEVDTATDIHSSASMLEPSLSKPLPANTFPSKPPSANTFSSESLLSENPVRIGIARDEAFCFYYHDNLKALEQAGATLEFFSPLHDETLPTGLAGLYLGGGYPERFAEAFFANKGMFQALQAFAGVLYAEGGGRMVLAQSLSYEGRCTPMLGSIAGHVVFEPAAPLQLGYRWLEALQDSPALSAGEQVKGHEFHYSSHTGLPEVLFRSLERATYREGYATARLHASYVQLYFPASPSLAPRFVASARAFLETSSS